MKKFFTTAEAAKVCKVCRGVIQRAFDSEELKGYRLPGSGHRHIARESLISLMRKCGIPLSYLEDEGFAKVLFVTQDNNLIEGMKRRLPPQKSFRIEGGAAGFNVGVILERLRPDCVVVDFSIGRTEALQICQNLRRNSEYSDVIIIALLLDDEFSIPPMQCRVNDTLRRPFDFLSLAGTLITLIGEKKEIAGHVNL